MAAQKLATAAKIHCTFYIIVTALATTAIFFRAANLTIDYLFNAKTVQLASRTRNFSRARMVPHCKFED